MRGYSRSTVIKCGVPARLKANPRDTTFHSINICWKKIGKPKLPVKFDHSMFASMFASAIEESSASTGRSYTRSIIKIARKQSFLHLLAYLTKDSHFSQRIFKLYFIFHYVLICIIFTLIPAARARQFRESGGNFRRMRITSRGHLGTFRVSRLSNPGVR